MKWKNRLLFAAVLAACLYFFQLGHWLMLAALVFLIVVHELGHWFFARLFGMDAPVFSVGMGSAPRFVFGKFWGTEFQITPWLLGGYVQIDPSADNFKAHAPWKRAVVLVAGVTMNVLTAVVAFFLLFTLVGKPEAVIRSTSIDRVLSQPAVARNAGLRAGDRFISIDGQPVIEPRDVSAAFGASKGSAVTVVLERAGQNLTVELTPDADGHIGVFLVADGELVYRKMSTVKAASAAVSQAGEVLAKMVWGLGVMLGFVDVPPGLPDGAADVHGVVAIVQWGSSMFDSGGLYAFVSIVAIVSLNLALMNILPIPPLDGGHLLFLGLEKVFGKPVSPRLQNIIATIFLLLLLALMLLGLYNDIFKPVSFK